jgi:hypothetical protein
MAQRAPHRPIRAALSDARALLDKIDAETGIAS